MGEYIVRADTAKNRLYITLRGFLTDSEVKAAADTVIAEASKLRPGFDAINDITTFEPVSPEGTAEMVRAQQFVKTHGVRRIIRIQPQPSLGGLQLRRKAKEIGYEADTATSIEEAEKLLDQAQ